MLILNINHLNFLNIGWNIFQVNLILTQSRDAYHFKMAYPEEYKSNDTRIVKFEADHFQFLEYRFIGLFIISLNSTRVSYQNSQVLKATCSFSFDRYICGESSSLARALGLDLNNSSRRRTTNGTINYNDAGGLNEVMDGLALLNRDTAYQFGVGGTRTGSDTIEIMLLSKYLPSISKISFKTPINNFI